MASLFCDQLSTIDFFNAKNSYKLSSEFLMLPSPEAAVLPLDDSPKYAFNISVFRWLRGYLRQVKIYHKQSNSVKFNQFCDQFATNSGGLL